MLTLAYILAAFDAAVALFIVACVAWSARAAVVDLRHRGEVADPVDAHADSAMAVLANVEALADRAICEAMEWQFPKTKTRRIR